MILKSSTVLFKTTTQALRDKESRSRWGTNPAEYHYRAGTRGHTYFGIEFHRACNVASLIRVPRRTRVHSPGIPYTRVMHEDAR